MESNDKRHSIIELEERLLTLTDEIQLTRIILRGIINTFENDYAIPNALRNADDRSSSDVYESLLSSIYMLSDRLEALELSYNI